ncbi:acyl carrier protein [Bacteroides sp. 51]|uniref:acyl carrier protein n=1 Tax=Bacteroides sp. 51 TaxID=2302938 RepID=UPI0013D439D0|nr:phosphopantetheine-binding protein [Bacteroides sp. 51]NDV84496.1 acyl carrier protein [Bacteroides sp. 51]
MEKLKLIEKANEVLAEEFEIEVADITPDSNIKETLQLDSLSLVDMVALIEQTFGVKIKSQEVASIQTFDSLYDFIHERISA